MSAFVPAGYGEKVYDLAVGFEPLDALRGGRVATPLRFEIEGALPRGPADEASGYRHAIGPFGARPVLARHDSCLFALLYQPQLVPGNLRLRIYDHRRRFVPRRLEVPIVDLATAEGQPLENRVRRPVLYPGAACDLSARSTGIRGRAVRDGEPLRWARVEARLEGSGLIVGRAHGDDRGEFLLVLDANAAPAADLIDPLPVRVTVFGPAVAPVAETDFLWGLPLETLPSPGAPDPISAAKTLPAGYVDSSLSSRIVGFRLGRLISTPEFVFS